MRFCKVFFDNVDKRKILCDLSIIQYVFVKCHLDLRTGLSERNSPGTNREIANIKMRLWGDLIYVKELFLQQSNVFLTSNILASRVLFMNS